MLNAPITPPRVPLIDRRTGLIDRAWYLFFLSLNDVATSVIDDSGLTFSAESVIASYDAALRVVNQDLQTLPSTVDSNSLVSQIAELQKQVEGLQLQPQNAIIGATGSFITANIPSKTVTVVDGIITSIV